MAKKRKSEYTSQSATLHDFFGKPGRATPKKAKVEPSASRIPLKCINPEDIIIIDSDDDDPKMPSGGPGLAIPSTSSMSSNRRVALSRQSKDDPHCPSNRSFNSDEANRPHLDTTEETSFGLPLLLTPDMGAVDHSPPSSVFGTPSLLLPPTPRASVQSNSAASPAQNMSPTAPLDGCTPPPAMKVLSNDSDDSSSKPGEEWATGDDEAELHGMEFSPEVIEEDTVDIDLTLEEDDAVDVDLTLDTHNPSPPDERVKTCPLCEKKLLRLNSIEVNEHVNRCMDSMATTVPRDSSRATVPTSLSSEVDTKPVSSYQACTASSSKIKLEDQEPLNSKPGAFSVLMTSHKENEAWKEASVAEDRNFRPTKSNGGRRKAPFYKVMQGMPIAVDAFRYGAIPGVKAYFLTHAHSDHYTNLSAKWDTGPIYCSEGTANLIVHMLGVDRKWVHPLPLDIATTIPDTGGVQVTPIEANHCPGSCLFLFEGQQTINAGDSAYKSPFVGSSKVFRYLHCGDFRASPAHAMHPAIKGKRIDHVYLDTTYLDPKYCFPPQPQVIAACAELARRIVAGIPLHEDAAKAKQNSTMDKWVTTSGVKVEKNEQDMGRTLVVVGTYSIGKERIVKAIARALKTKVFCDSRKAAILRCQDDPELHSLLTKDPLEGGVHLVPLGVIASDRLKEYVERFKGHYSKAVGFRPTGWTFTAPTGSDMLPSVQTIISRSQSRTFTYAQMNPTRNSTAVLQVYGVPYSEHSSFFELTCFALSLDWGKMIATVNVGSENSRKKMSKWFERWEAEKKKGKDEIVGYRAEDYW